MKIVDIKSHILQHDLTQELGYSQQFYSRRTAHLVEVITDEGLIGWGECFGPGDVAVANAGIVEGVIAPMVVGSDPLDREVIWHRVYNLLRDHGQKGMAVQAMSGIDIALWDLLGKITGLPLYKLLGGAARERIPVYGYGMMLRRVDDLPSVVAEEAAVIEAAGFRAMKMKIGLGPKRDIELVRAVRAAISADAALMVDANHCYTATEALQVGRELEKMSVSWFEEPVAPEDRAGYRYLTDRLDIPIAGGEAEYTRWGWRDLLEGRSIAIAQPEVCSLGGITEYLKVLALCHANFIPVVNHVWGSSVAVATNLHLLASMPDLPGSVHPVQPMLEYDTTPSHFHDELLEEPLDILSSVAHNGGTVSPPNRPGIGVEIRRDHLTRFEVRRS